VEPRPGCTVGGHWRVTSIPPFLFASLLKTKICNVDASDMRRGAFLRRASWPRAPARAARPDRERGAALVEFTIIAPILFLIIFGMIDFGIAFADYQNVRSGTREAARLGVVNDLTNAPTCKINGVSVTPPADPSTIADATNALICKAKDRIGLNSGEAKIKVVVTGQAVGDRLRICASFPVSSLTGLTATFLSDRVLTSSVTMRLEQVPAFQDYTETGNEC
jgi:Flp pilus assembly protein TadG